MSEITNPIPGAFKDRSVGLLVYGILTVLLGLLFLLFVPLLLFAGSVNAAAHTGPQPSFWPMIGICGVLAVVNILLGIGSVMRRRWARALLLIASWGWLIIGIFVVIGSALILPTALQGAPAGQEQILPGTQLMITVAVLLFYSAIFIALPLAWLLFYRSAHVKATCEHFDPVRRWTDACPLPVLVMALLYAAYGVIMVVVALAGPAKLMFFGTLFSVFAARAVYLGLAGVLIVIAWGIFRLDRRALWLAVFLILLSTVSSVLTAGLHSPSEIYEGTSVGPDALAMIQGSDFVRNYLIIAPIIGAVLNLGYLAFISRYFAKAGLPPLPSAQA